MPAHEPRPTDVDPVKEKRAERQVAALFGLSALCTILFVVSYFAFDVGDNWNVVGGFGASTLALGGTLGLSLLFIGIAIIQWARKLMGDHEIVEMRHPAYSEEADRQRALADLKIGFEETGIARRPLIRQVGARRRSACSASPPWSCSATSARCPATSSSTRSGARAAARSRSSRTARK